MTVIDKDMGWEALGERLAEVSDGSAFVLVGIQGATGEAQHRDDGMTNIELGTIHEFGLGVPQRSFIREAIDQYQQPIADIMGELGSRVVLGDAHPSGPMTENQALALLGEQVVKIIQQRITAHIPPPLSEATKKKKGSDTPLIEYGVLRKSITYEVGSAT
jgi:hypothetical protein